jgi:two-component system phosphate regulon sensor histidine kinase PhoR
MGGEGTNASARPNSSRVAAAILGTQMLISAAELVVVVAVIVFAPTALTVPALFVGIGCLFILCGVTAIVPWERVPRRWRVALPMLNILAIGLVRAAEPHLGSGLLLVFPVIWLARAFTARETAAGVGLSIAAIWAGRAFAGGPLVVVDFGTLVLLPITLGFVATIVYLAARRTRAQSVLLRQHSRLIESSLERLSRQQTLLGEVLNTVGFGILVFNHKKQVIFVNRTYRRWLDAFGEPRDASVFHSVYRPDRVTPYPEEERPFIRAINGREYDNVVIWVGEPGKRRAAYAATARMIRDAHDEQMAGLIVLKDVTQELDAVRARDDLVGSVTHELRSPLTSILGYLDLVSEADLAPETREQVRVASGNAERLLVIVNDLLRAAGDADKNLPFSFVRGDVTEIAREAVAAQLLFAEEHEVELTVEAPDAVYAMIDQVRMRQLMDNLVTNAIKYNREWGEVMVRIVENDGAVTIEVRDTGQGIPEADLPRIFDRFYRTRSARTSTTVGSGLGLAITREIVENHGGELSVESVYGLGSTFRVTIPSAYAAGTTENVVAEEGVGEESEQA